MQNVVLLNVLAPHICPSLSIFTWRHDTQHNDTQQERHSARTTLSITTLSMIINKTRHSAKGHSALRHLA